MSPMSFGGLFDSPTPPPSGAITVTVAGTVPTVDTKAVLTLLAPGSPFFGLTLPITDPEVDYTALEDDWVEVPRPGRKPLLVRRGGKLRKLKLKKVTVMADDPTQSVETILEVLARTASSAGTDGSLANPLPVALTYAPMDSASWLTMTGHWQVTSMTVTSRKRQPGTNAVILAEATVELTENSDPPAIAPGSQGVGAGILPPVPTPTTNPGAARPPRVAIVQIGDTLFTVAVRIYGAAEPGWMTLANANGIIDPRAIVAGQVLIVP